jgi:hypothetical protein
MALKPKSIIETAVELGRGAVSRGTELVSRRLKNEPDAAPTTPATPTARSTPSTAKTASKSKTATKSKRAAKAKTAAKPSSGSPSTVGAPKPGKPRGPKSATAGGKKT